MLITLSGKTCSGKNSILEELKRLGYSAIVTYTTRPIRIGEIDGITYHYISEKEFKKKIGDGFFLEYKAYHTTEGIWYYGSAKEDYLDDGRDKVIILTPSGVGGLMNQGNIVFRSFYIYSDFDTIRKRLDRRGDNEIEATRRLNADNIDFVGFENVADHIIYNQIDGVTPEQLAMEIVKYVRGEKL